MCKNQIYEIQHFHLVLSEVLSNYDVSTGFFAPDPPLYSSTANESVVGARQGNNSGLTDGHVLCICALQVSDWRGSSIGFPSHDREVSTPLQAPSDLDLSTDTTSEGSQIIIGNLMPLPTNFHQLQWRSLKVISPSTWNLRWWLLCRGVVEWLQKSGRSITPVQSSPPASVYPDHRYLRGFYGVKSKPSWRKIFDIEFGNIDTCTYFQVPWEKIESVCVLSTSQRSTEWSHGRYVDADDRYIFKSECTLLLHMKPGWPTQSFCRMWNFIELMKDDLQPRYM